MELWSGGAVEQCTVWRGGGGDGSGSRRRPQRREEAGQGKSGLDRCGQAQQGQKNGTTSDRSQITTVRETAQQRHMVLVALSTARQGGASSRDRQDSTCSSMRELAASNTGFFWLEDTPAWPSLYWRTRPPAPSSNPPSSTHQRPQISCQQAWNLCSSRMLATANPRRPRPAWSLIM